MYSIVFLRYFVVFLGFSCLVSCLDADNFPKKYFFRYRVRPKKFHRVRVRVQSKIFSAYAYAYSKNDRVHRVRVRVRVRVHITGLNQGIFSRIYGEFWTAVDFRSMIFSCLWCGTGMLTLKIFLRVRVRVTVRPQESESESKSKNSKSQAKSQSTFFIVLFFSYFDE